MEHNHMLAPASHREPSTHGDDAASVLGPPPAPPPLHLLSFSPPAYSKSAAANATAIQFPDVPTTELPPVLPPASSHHDTDIRLPSLSSLTSAVGPRDDVILNPPQGQWAPMNQFPAVYHTPSHSIPQTIDSPARMDIDTSSNSVNSAASPDRLRDVRSTSVNLDDPDVRLAAEALGDLRADFISSPPNRNTSLPLSPPTAHGFQPNSTQPRSPPPEPLLSLLTTSHPLLASTIEGATSAYGGAKNFSPRFRSGAEYVEGYLTPIANTVGSVGRVTGVEGSVRWFLRGSRRQGNSADLEALGNSKKRRQADGNTEPISNKRLEGEGMVGLQQTSGEIETGPDTTSAATSKTASRRMSMASTVDTLPAYDDVRSPAYTETVDGQNSPRPSSSNGAWQSRLIMSTSGLSVAMSEESLRSLKYCLRWLRWANGHIGRVIDALRSALEQYEKTDEDMSGTQQSEKQLLVASQDGPAHESRDELAARITNLKNDVLKTLQSVISTVSKYAGGALPENARILVRRHLTSLPQRFRMAAQSSENSSQTNGKHNDSALREGTQKVLVLAKEGLDMVAQVSGVVDGTIVSAEEWCDRMGKKRREPDLEKQDSSQTQMEANGDVKMS